MQLTADQELRRELLLFSLSKHADLEAAIKSAAEMERFVLRGGGADAGAVERLADGTGGARGHSSEPSFGVGREASSRSDERRVGNACVSTCRSRWARRT